MGALSGFAASAAVLMLPLTELAEPASGQGRSPPADGTERSRPALWLTAPKARGNRGEVPLEQSVDRSADRPGDGVGRWHAAIADASARFAVPIRWIEQVMRAESGGQTLWNGLPITSRAGAMGLMQVMPATWAAMRAMLGLGDDPQNPRDNILAGTAYLRLLYERFGYPGLFAAYNAGPGRYQRHLATREPLPAETRAYLAKVTAMLPPVAGEALPKAEGVHLFLLADHDARVPPTLFVSLRGGDGTYHDAAAARSPSPPSDPLFAVRRAP